MLRRRRLPVWIGVAWILFFPNVWMAETPTNTYTIGFLPAIHNAKGHYKHYVGAFLYALEKINSNWTGHVLNYNYVHQRSSLLDTIRDMTTMHFNGTLAFIGPPDTCRTESTIAAAWNRPMISYKCSESSIVYKETFARTIPSTSKVSKSLISIMKHFKWSKFTLIVENKTNWRAAAVSLADLAEKHGMEIIDTQYYNSPYVSSPNNGMRRILEQIYTQARVFVLFCDRDALVDFARAIKQMGINKDGEYVVIAVHDRPFEPTNNKYTFNFMDEVSIGTWNISDGVYQNKMYETTKNANDAFQNVLLMLHHQSESSDYVEFVKKTREYSSRPPFNVTKSPFYTIDVFIPIYGAYLYDAVHVYWRALNETIAAGEDVTNGTLIVSRIHNRSYESIRGYTMYIDENGDAETTYTVLALKKDESAAGDKRSMQPVGSCSPDQRENGMPSFTYDEGSINWIAGHPPVSEPPCGFDGSKCTSNINYTLLGVSLLVAAITFSICFFFAGRRYIYEQRVASELWKIDYKDLVMSMDDVQDPLMSEKVKEEAQRRLERRTHTTTKPGVYGLFSSDDSNAREEAKLSKRGSSFRVGSYKGSLVAVRFLKRKNIEISKSVKRELHLLKEMTCDNINRFHGACIDLPTICIVTQYCARGSLKDILENDDLHLDDMFTASLIFDLIKGMIFLHDSEIVSHGNLKSSNCLVDSRWVLQITDFGLHALKGGDPNPIQDENTYYSRLLWRAPELLRDPCSPPQGTQKGDVYSFAIILFEVHGRNGPWGQTIYRPKEIIEKVKKPPDGWLLRPDLSLMKGGEFVVRCIQDCWCEEAESRPDFKYIRMRLKPMQKGLRSNIFDNMLAIMEKHANNLEAIVSERTHQLIEEKKKTEALLLRMLPRSVAEQLKRGENVVPEHYDAVTIYFSDICGFTSISAESTPMQVIDMLNDLYTTFDSIIGEYDVYKVETIGDAYVVVSGLPIRNGNNHAGEIASMSLHLLSAIASFTIKHREHEKLNLRIGLHSGPVVAGVVGLKMPRYCLFGDTVNTASRMESNGVPRKIHCSRECKEILDLLGGYQMQERGLVDLKGKGQVFTYFLLGEDESLRLRRISVDTKPDEPDKMSTTTSQRMLHQMNKEKDHNSTSSLLASDSHTDSDEDGNVNILVNGRVKYVNEEVRPFSNII